jgi:flagellar export protein FliJ
MSLMVDLTDMQAGEMDLFAIQHVRSNIKLVEDRIEVVQRSICDIQVQVDAKRSEVILARQGEETLKTLKNHEIERYKLEQAQVENRQIDDIYISQAYRNRHAGDSYR